MKEPGLLKRDVGKARKTQRREKEKLLAEVGAAEKKNNCGK